MSELFTVTALCYQEILCIRGWLENMLGIADRILISEGGSTDGTLDVLAEYQSKYKDRIEVIPWNQSRNPQFEDFDEGARRNQLAQMVTEGYLIKIDVDEMLPDNFRQLAAPYLSPDHSLAGTWLNFWRTPNMIRVESERDKHWGPHPRFLLFPAGTVTFDMNTAHSDALTCPQMIVVPEIIIYHYHYLFALPKVKENRYCDWIDESIEMKLKGYAGPHPKALQYLTETINFAHLIRPEPSGKRPVS